MNKESMQENTKLESKNNWFSNFISIAVVLCCFTGIYVMSLSAKSREPGTLLENQLHAIHQNDPSFRSADPQALSNLAVLVHQATFSEKWIYANNEIMGITEEPKSLFRESYDDFMRGDIPELVSNVTNRARQVYLESSDINVIVNYLAEDQCFYGDEKWTGCPNKNNQDYSIYKYSQLELNQIIDHIKAIAAEKSDATLSDKAKANYILGEIYLGSLGVEYMDYKAAIGSLEISWTLTKEGGAAHILFDLYSQTDSPGNTLLWALRSGNKPENYTDSLNITEIQNIINMSKDSRVLSVE